jgi:hypothetical protein
MKQLLLYIPILLFSFDPGKPVSGGQSYSLAARNFKLRFVTIGFGSNMFRMQPVFSVNNSSLVYTAEQVWVRTGDTNIRRDTLLVCNFRVSSIDSISNLISNIKDSVVYKVDPYIMSGVQRNMVISDGIKQIRFQLHNASDTTAEKIISILHTYIPKKILNIED